MKVLHMRVGSAIVLGMALLAVPIASSAQERSQPRIIRKIAVEGLRRLSEPTVLAKMKIRIGQPYDRKAVSDETANLYKTGEFSEVLDPEVAFFEDGVVVTFRVVEKPKVTAVKFQVLDSPSGKPSISQKDLREEITTKPDGFYTEYTGSADADRIRRLYGEKGYPFTDVRVEAKAVGTNMEVTFVIDEGTRVRIREIEFVGNRAIDAGDLRGVMETKTKDFFFGLFNPGFYDPKILERDIGQVTSYYRGKGFFEARASVDDFAFDPEMEKLRIVIRIFEGPRYTFRGYDFEGNRIFSTPVLAGLTRAETGNPYDEERMQEDRKEILKYYRDRAYIDSKVDPEYRPSFEGTDVRILFRIEEGNEITINQIRVKKNEHTQDRVIRRELEVYPGEKVNYSRIEKSKSNLARLQIFKDVRISWKEVPGARDRKDLEFEVEEERTGRLILGFGVTSGFGLIGNFSILKRNFDISDVPDSIFDIPDRFTGAGQTLKIALQPGTRRSLYQLQFVEPYIFDTRNSLSLSGSYLTIYRSDYDERRLSFTPRIGHAFDFDRDLVFSLGTRIEEVQIKGIDQRAAPDVIAAKGYHSIIALNAGLTYDKVLQDRLEGPYDGHREVISYEYGGEPIGGQVDFHREEASLDLYFPIYVHEEDQLHHVIGLFSKVGGIQPHHSTEDIPIFERFFLGGPNTVRGFRFRGLGPHLHGDSLGGTTAWYGNVEYVFPLFMKYLRGVIFFDYGNLAPDLDSFTIEETRLAAGGGIRINFPFLGSPLPIGLYLGHAFRREASDKPRLFLFTIGMPF
jgi:outer membrane protein insertion porin family